MRRNLQKIQKKKEQLLQKKYDIEEALALVLKEEQDLIYHEVIMVYEQSQLSLEEFTNRIFEKEHKEYETTI
ncbi:TPA: hypothetical protein ACT2FU_001240 [Streptococcus suis]